MNQTVQQASHPRDWQNIINAINEHPTYSVEEEAYITVLHDRIDEARARHEASISEVKHEQR